MEPTSLYTARWIEADDPLTLKKFINANGGAIADDHDGEPVFMARNSWHLDQTAKDWPAVRFLKTKEQTK
jgi:peptide chain release factor 3